jgi:hypothetical protein
VSDLKLDRQRRDLHKSNLPVTSRKIGPVLINFHLKVLSVMLAIHKHAQVGADSHRCEYKFSLSSPKKDRS